MYETNRARKRASWPLVLALTCLASGQFKPAKYYKLGGKEVLSLQVIAADFNNDGVLDLAVADALSNKVSVLLGNSDGPSGRRSYFR